MSVSQHSFRALRSVEGRLITAIDRRRGRAFGPDYMRVDEVEIDKILASLKRSPTSFRRAEVEMATPVTPKVAAPALVVAPQPEPETVVPSKSESVIRKRTPSATTEEILEPVTAIPWPKPTFVQDIPKATVPSAPPAQKPTPAPVVVPPVKAFEPKRREEPKLKKPGRSGGVSLVELRANFGKVPEVVQPPIPEDELNRQLGVKPKERYTPYYFEAQGVTLRDRIRALDPLKVAALHAERVVTHTWPSIERMLKVERETAKPEAAGNRYRLQQFVACCEQM